MTNIWLPMIPPNATNSQWSLPWFDEWSLKDF